MYSITDAVDQTSVTNWRLFQGKVIFQRLGALIGLERETAKKDASFRTFSLVCLGACLITILSVFSAMESGSAESGRIAAQIVSGVGFLGAGVIFRSEERITGLTTAALLWVTAGIGMAVGFGQADLAISTTGLVLTILIVFRFLHRSVLKKYRKSRQAREAAVRGPTNEGLQ